jgi:tetratricopeptide (TPR) repeat protein
VARAQSPGEEEVAGFDEEFLYHLSRGSDLLARGEAELARASLERALQLRPRDTTVLGLLGQACYRLGRFEDAADAYGRLVNDNPTEAGARVNLGLANLKARRYAEAVKELGVALDLNPEHKKAMGYLGLAHLEAGDVRAAREWFARAGSAMMLARCDEMLAAASAASAVALATAPQEARATVPEEVREPLRAPLPADLPPERAAAATGYPDLASYAGARLVVPLPADPFGTDGRNLTVSVRGEMLSRIDGLFAARGTLQIQPAMKRFRGKATDKPFGEGAMRMHRVSGEGALLYRARGRRFTALDLAGEAGYFREEAVFALEEPVVFENGRVPSKLPTELNLVHLRGRGRFLLASEGEPVAVEVVSGVPLRVPLVALVGWVGALTPRVMSLTEAPGGAPAEGGEAPAAGPVMVELTGDGRALVDPAASVAPDAG